MLSVTPVTMESVKLIECPRDAWQGLPRQIPTARKVEYLRALVAAGFRHIDAVSFVSPKVVPQMADSEAVLEQLDKLEGVEIIGIVVNEKGAARAIETGEVKTLGYPCSISETFLRRNQNQSRRKTNRCSRRSKRWQTDRAWRWSHTFQWRSAIRMAIRGTKRGSLTRRESIFEMGIKAISLADTVGAAEPERIDRVLRVVLRSCPEGEIGVHLHSTRATAGAKVLAAFDAGCRRFDSAIGGLGGCPFAQDDLVGNIPTEEVDWRAGAAWGARCPCRIPSPTS